MNPFERSLSLSHSFLSVFVFFPSFPAKYVIFCRLLFCFLVLHDLVYFRECNMCVCAELRLSSGPRLSTSRDFPDFWVMDVADFARIVSIAAASVKPLLLASCFMLLNPLYVPWESRSYIFVLPSAAHIILKNEVLWKKENSKNSTKLRYWGIISWEKACYASNNNELAFFWLCSSFTQHWHDISHHAIELHSNVGDLCSCLTLRKKTKKALKIPIRPSCTLLFLYLFVARNKQIYLLTWIGKAIEPALRDLSFFEGYF